MKITESIALAITTAVSAFIIFTFINESGIASGLTAPQWLPVWIGVQTATTALILWLLPRRPVLYVRHDRAGTDGPSAS